MQTVFIVFGGFRGKTWARTSGRTARQRHCSPLTLSYSGWREGRLVVQPPKRSRREFAKSILGKPFRRVPLPHMTCASVGKKKIKGRRVSQLARLYIDITMTHAQCAYFVFKQNCWLEVSYRPKADKSGLGGGGKGSQKRWGCRV